MSGGGSPAYYGKDGWFTSNAAIGGGQGTAADPLTMAEALAGAGDRIVSGQVINVDATIHQLPQATDVNLNGSNSARITFKPKTAKTQWIIDQQTGMFRPAGQYQTYRNMRVRSSNAVRTGQSGDTTLSTVVFGHVQIDTLSGEFISCRFENLANFAAFNASAGLLMLGCTVIWPGYDTPAQMEGQAFYTQNNAAGVAALYKTMTACFFIALGRGALQAYGSGSSNINGYTFTSSVFADGDITVGNASDTDNLSFAYCLFMRTQARIGYGAKAQKTVALDHCAAPQLQINLGWNSFTFNSGIIISPDDVVIVGDHQVQDYTQIVHMDNNVYITPKANPFKIDLVKNMTFAQWKAESGQDASSSIYTSVAAAISAGAIPAFLSRIGVVNQDDHVANIWIWNYALNATVTIDLTSVTISGHNYELRQVKDYDNDRRSFTASASAVVITMSGTLETPTDAPFPYHPSAQASLGMPEFGLFELRDVT